MEGNTTGPTKKQQPLSPSPKVQERMRPMSRKGFYNLLKRVISPKPAPKPAPKST
jgi:hypothetical protein